MVCPNCEYDISCIYDKVLYTGEYSKFCKITVKCKSRLGYKWAVNCICPRCGLKYTFFDESKGEY